MSSKYFQILVASFIAYTLLSWVLLFRQEQTLLVIGQFYPRFADVLPMVRQFLLHIGLNSAVTAIFALVLAISFVSYWQLLKEKLSGKTAVLVVSLCQFIVFFSYPALSTDVFDYILTNRVAIVYRENIWETPPAAFPKDPFYHLANWQNQIAPYGAVNQFFYSFAGFFSGSDLLQAILAHKILVLVFVFAVYTFVKKVNPQAVFLIFANPLFVIETAGNAHNIILTIFFLLLTYSLYQKEKFFLAGGAAALAVHTKFLPLFLAIFLVVDLLARKRTGNLFRFIVSFTLTNIALFSFIGIGTVSYLATILVGKPILWQSLPNLIHKVFPQGNLIFFFLFFLFFLFQLWRGWRHKVNPIILFVETTLGYLLFFTSFYLNWYALWILAFVPFIPWGRLARIGIVLTMTSALAYPLYMLSLRFNYQHPLWPILIYLLIAGIPAVYYLGQGHDKISKNS